MPQLDVYKRQFQPNRLQHRIEQFAGPPDEWFTLPIFIRAGRFANHQPLRPVVAYPEHGLSPGLTPVSYTHLDVYKRQVEGSTVSEQIHYLKITRS